MRMSRSSFLKKSILFFSTIPLLSNADKKDIPKNEPSNILNFGAKGDGKHDDSKSFLNAIAKHGECYIPSSKNSFILGNINLNGAKVFGSGTIAKEKSSKFIFQVSGTGATIDGLTFKSMSTYSNDITEIKLNDGSTNISITNCNFLSNIYSAISADTNGDDDSSLTYKTPVSSIIISNCIFDGKYSRPLFLHSVSNINITNNFLKNTLYDAIRLRQKTGKCIISKNQFLNIGTDISSDTQDAIDSYWSGDELIITDNIIDKVSKHGLDLKGHSPDGTYGTGNIIISNNIISNCSHSAISLSGSHPLKNGKYKPITNVIIRANILKSNNISKTASGNAAVVIRNSVHNVTITSNQIVNNFSRAIFVSNITKEAPQNENLIISDNQILDNKHNGDGYGIILSSVESFVIRGNIVKNNDIGIVVVNDSKRGFANSTGIVERNIVKDNTKGQFIIPKSTEILQKDNS